MRPLLPSAAALVCALLLSGCAGASGGLPPYAKTVTAADLAGTWNGDCHATLTLAADHGLRATGFPTGADATNQTVTTRVSGTGDWHILPGTGADNPAIAHITIGSTQTHLDFATGTGGSLVLAVTVGDPDNGVGCRFTRA